MTDPYRVPASTLTNPDQSKDEPPLATRGSRFGAALIDGVIGFLIVLPLFYLSGSWMNVVSDAGPSLLVYILSLIFAVVGYALVHGYFLHQSGQTLGKKALGIRIENLEGNLIGAPAIIGKRYLPVVAASLVPGNILPLIDALFIFRKDRRCVHDMIAGTRVVKRGPQ